MEKISGQRLVPFEIVADGDNTVIKIAGVELADIVTEPKDLETGSEVAGDVLIGRAMYTDRPVIPQGHRLRW